ncbi:DUF3604 domain-containing protein [Natronolimnohabitans innermongolicus]|uniref:DUF3604 domain-containing protein n=1 Tax=Natronolimnohabitans innermongolicus JCM 12255 TaxID=1227499 RepID=L9X5I2_9EURY|nr:DUF3604 domain-containing protein [Natronolimnohabitans innermongolicus]ELY57029.1 hypothetical protein C493_09383 [Natronolimnohabitans innermongolicus JCM 12255]
MSGNIQDVFGDRDPERAEIDRHYGTVTISADEVTAGTYGTWTITYTVGQFGLDDGAKLKVSTNQTSDWGRPQFEDPRSANYCSVATDGDAIVEGRFDRRYQNPRPWNDNVIVDIYDGYLGEGETITITFGDTSGGSLGHRIQSFPEAAFNFLFQVDMQGTGDYLLLEALDYEVVAGDPTALEARAPSDADPGESIDVGLRAVDYYGNTASEYEGRLEVSVTGAGEREGDNDGGDGVDATVSSPVDVDESVSSIPVAFDSPGIFRVTVTDPDRGWEATSNPVRCDPDARRRLYWGDIHGQSGKTVGTGSIDEYFRFAREDALLDFSSHCANDFQVDEFYWREIKDAVERYHEPGEHVTLLANEWSANTVSGGDHNVYYRHTDEPLVASGSWQDGDGFRKHEGTYPIEALYDRYEGRDDVLIVPHQGGRPARLRDPDRDAIDADRTTLVEINSIWGVFEWFGQEAIERGYRVGFVCSSDDHTGRLGAARPTNHFEVDETASLQAADFNVSGGLMAASLSDLSRDELWDAMTERRVYGTTGERILLETALEDASMGESTTIDAGTTALSFGVEVHGTAPIARVNLFDGSERVDTTDLTDGEHLLEFTWSGARSKNRHKVQDASGGLSLSAGRIVDATAFGFDHPEQGLTGQTATTLEWDSTISGNYQGVRLALEAPEDAKVTYSVPFLSETVALGSLGDETIIDAGGVDRQLAIRRVGEATARDVTLEFDLSATDSGDHAYYVRVVQTDGEMAWSSPIYATLE